MVQIFKFNNSNVINYFFLFSPFIDPSPIIISRHKFYFDLFFAY
jgi:hypothetical protein